MIRFTGSLFKLVAAIAAVAFLTAHVAGTATAPPRPAHRSTIDTIRLRRQLRYLAEGCFHVAPLQWVCPLPAPTHR